MILHKVTNSILFFVSMMSMVFVVAVQAENPFEELKDTHFIIQYFKKEDDALAREVLRRAQEYYDTIARDVGYARYDNFWTWDERVKIIMYHDKDTFTAETGQPAWSSGFASRDGQLLKSRSIVTYRQEENFLDGLLPHEISHLILKDLIGFERPIPLWFDEGVAQLQENHQDVMERVIQYLVRAGQHIPFDIFVNLDIRGETNTKTVMMFYGQSYTVVHFLIKTYGKDKFIQLCRDMRDGKNFEESLKDAYYPTIDSLKALEEKWTAFMLN